MVENGTLSHAYLFYGEEHPDTIFQHAYSLAYFLERNSFSSDSSAPLSECFVVSREEGSIGIDRVRALQEFLFRAPVFSLRRTVILRDASALTPESQHALLKILEEPPAPSLIIFIIAHEEALFPTLLSRMQKIYFRADADLRRQERRSTGTLTDAMIEEIVKGEDSLLLDQVLTELIRARSTSIPATLREYPALREILMRGTNLARYNLNTRLQLRALQAFLRDADSRRP